MGRVTQNGEQHVLIIVIPSGKIFGKEKKSKTMTLCNDKNSVNDC
jgi:hypothetical protein